jgi:AraC-like DNA-binding protein
MSCYVEYYEVPAQTTILSSAALVSVPAKGASVTDPFRSRNLLDNLHIRLFQVACATFNAGEWGVRNVQSSFWRFYMNSRDGAALELENGIYPLRAGQLYFVPAGVYFHCRSDAPFEHFYAHFDVIGVPGLALRELFSQPIEVPQREDLRATTRVLADDIADGAALDLPRQCVTKALLYNGIAAYLQELGDEKRNWLRHLSAAHGPMLPALHYIEENLAERLTNADLARLCHLSEDHFIRRFRECVGQSPLQYVLERRVTLAAQRLLFTDQSIDQIALATGFGNRFYFSRVFARHTGVSPAAYRKTSRV